MLRLYLLIGIVFVLHGIYSCSALSDVQKNVIKDFASSGKTYCDAPKTVLDRSSDCLTKASQLEAVSATDLNMMMDLLDRSSERYIKRANYDETLNLSLRLLNQYFQALAAFVDIDTASDMKTNIATLGTNVDSLATQINAIRPHLKLPVGFGAIAGNALKYVGEKHISHAELKEARKFVAKGDSLVSGITPVLHEVVVQTLLNGELREESKNVRTNYLNYLRRFDSASKTAGALYKDLNPGYVEIKNCFGESILLCQKLDMATGQLDSAHKELLEIISLKKTKDLNPKKIPVFSESVIELSDLISQFKPSN